MIQKESEVIQGPSSDGDNLPGLLSVQIYVINM